MTTRLSRHCVLVVAVVVVLSVGASVGLAAGWPGSNGAMPISGSTSLLVRGELYVASSDIDLAAFNGGLAAAWASSTDAPGIVTATMTGGTWDQPSLISEPKRAWAPSITYDGNGPSAVWARGDNHENPNVARSLIGFDAITGTQVIAADFYGQTSPDLVTSPHGDYLVYAAVETDDPNNLNATSTDLYFAFRPAEETDWPDPQVIMSATTVVTNAVTGGISSPQVAVVPGADLSAEVVHVVWEQHERDGDLQVSHSVWHTSGTHQDDQVVWGDIEKLSPGSQRFAVRPAVAVSEDGKVRVSWTELTGPGTSDPGEQYIHYMLLGGGTATTLNSLPIRVNNPFPGLSVSSLGAQGEMVCASWHGYTGPQGGSYEEIYLRCSQDGGQTWLATVQVSDTLLQSSAFARVVLDQDGAVHVVWVEYERPVSGELVRESLLEAVPIGIFYRTGNPVHATFLPLVLRAR